MTEGAAPALPKPLPQPTLISQPFWDAARERRLSIQRCAACNRYVFYPRPLCPYCGATDLAWTDVSGRGTLYSYTIARRPTARPFEPDVPYVIAIVELEEGPRMVTNIVDVEQTPEALVLDMALDVTFERLSDEISLPVFRPAEA